MKSISAIPRSFLTSTIVAAALASTLEGKAIGVVSAARAEADTTGTLLVCGGPQVLRLTVRFAGDTVQVLSRTAWEADKSKGMPAEMVPLFRTTDDCKPIDGGARVLVTSSGNGVAIFERETGETRFYATVANAHSAEVLPNDRVVVAASVNPQGNRLIVFDRARSGVELFSTPLVSAHGTHWVEAERTLWALGGTELHAYDLVNWDSTKPSMKLRRAYTLPSRGGHDLSPIPGSSSFIVTTETQVLAFDRTTGRFEPYREIAAAREVKSVSIHPTTGRVVFVQADRPEWWSRTIRFLDPAATLTFADDRLYKARWAVESAEPPPPRLRRVSLERNARKRTRSPDRHAEREELALHSFISLHTSLRRHDEILAAARRWVYIDVPANRIMTSVTRHGDERVPASDTVSACTFRFVDSLCGVGDMAAE